VAQTNFRYANILIEDSEKTKRLIFAELPEIDKKYKIIYLKHSKISVIKEEFF
jgi:hypothetical protein